MRCEIDDRSVGPTRHFDLPRHHRIGEKPARAVSADGLRPRFHDPATGIGAQFGFEFVGGSAHPRQERSALLIGTETGLPLGGPLLV